VYWRCPTHIGRIAGSPATGRRNKTYWFVKLNGRSVKRANIVFCMTHGHWPSPQIDHIDGNSLNDAPENLREATVTQNARNHKTRAKRSPVPMGVRFQFGRFRARITVNKQQISLGAFDTPDEAANAYQAARREYFGEFA
jgi:hypothetical protein